MLSRDYAAVARTGGSAAGMLLLVCASGWTQTRFLGAQAGMPGHVVKNAPYSAEITTETTQTLPNGDHTRQTSSSKVFRDGEGRTRTEQSLTGLGAIAPGSSLPTVVFLQDPVAGTSFALDTVHKTATKSPWPRMGRGPGQKGPGPEIARGPAGEGRRGPRPNGESVRSEPLGRQTMEGVPVDGTRTTTTIPAGQIGNEQPIQIVTERWYSPDLQVYVFTRHSDPRAGETVTRVTNINRGEPARSLFEIPADFRVSEGPPRPGGAK